ncbi:zinc finger protein 34 [Aedes aegypti]|uniref:Uncharacterized protein n=1 Tax=Aedes aegypti TaxID=7159 RepID=A0A1S4FI90_AEDAE|nr:zinc finger protein 34 [Aedes aegypti]
MSVSRIIEEDPKASQSLQKVCRLCLSEESLEDIFHQNGLSGWISELLSIVVSQSDRISHWICVLCRIRMQEFRDYQTRCWEVQEVLMNEIATNDDEIGTFPLNIQKDEISVDDLFEVGSFSDEDIDEVENNLYNISPQKEQIVCLNTPDNPEIVRTTNTEGSDKKGYKGRHITCNICGKEVQRLRFDNHMNGHLGLRPYKCERGCKAEYFACKYKRQGHYRKVHDGVKHLCGFCDRSFGTRQGLFSHKRRHHTTSTHKCNICHQMFSSENLLKRHSKTHQASSAASPLSSDSTLTYENENLGKTNSDR